MHFLGRRIRRKFSVLLFSRISLRLGGKQLPILSPLHHQLGMVTTLHNFSLLQYQNFGGNGGAGKPVGYENGGLVLAQMFKLIEDFLFCQRIQACCGFIQNQHV